jgi:hypothetical protein
MRILPGTGFALLTCVLLCAPAHAVTLSFDTAPEITFEVPAGWVACDPVTAAALQGPRLDGKTKDLCTDFDSAGGARLVGSPDGSLAVSFVVNDSNDLPPSYFRDASPQLIADASATLCKSAFNVTDATTNCAFELASVANRPAIVGHVRTPHGEYEVGRMVIVASDSHSVAFVFMATPADITTQDMINTFVASIRIAAK